MEYYLTLIAGDYLASGVILLSTPNVMSTLLFKIIPFLLGMGTVILSASKLGWI